MVENPFLSVINSLLPEPQASLLAGMLFGVRATMSYPFYLALRDTGVLHVIALSGMNIAILIDIFGKLLNRYGRKFSAIFSGIIIILFVFFVGPSPTIVRAGIMGSMSLFAIILGRRYWSMLALFIASGVMLFLRPEWIGEVSFQLSFLATLGVILANKVVERERSGRWSKQLIYALKENIAMTVSAQLFTLPVIVYHFERISLVSPIANLLTGWSIQPIMILGILTSVLGWIWLPLGYIPAWITWVFLTYFVEVVEILAKLPFASISL